MCFGQGSYRRRIRFVWDDIVSGRSRESVRRYRVDLQLPSTLWTEAIASLTPCDEVDCDGKKRLSAETAKAAALAIPLHYCFYGTSPSVHEHSPPASLEGGAVVESLKTW